MSAVSNPEEATPSGYHTDLELNSPYDCQQQQAAFLLFHSILLAAFRSNDRYLLLFACDWGKKFQVVQSHDNNKIQLNHLAKKILK
ncbi:11117_t:CDS:2 [Paraglomus brasilianum]|uniref:11117_t:CDS:1 n=1 Tax=Paraglomus brasilianum TaxID=144538 RepID=A0A9N9BTY3_9GLOM|nr:11117_t:CDS:2 [Paraglomus brasilianum]